MRGISVTYFVFIYIVYMCVYIRGMAISLCMYVCENGLITVNTKINFMVMQYDTQLSYAYPGRR